MSQASRIEESLKDWAERVCINITECAKNTLKEEARNLLIQDYYDKYIPSVYDRTENFLRNSYSPYTDKRGEKYVGGIILSSEGMDDYYFSSGAEDPWNKDLIYEADMLGYHGAIKKISPFDSIVTFAQSQKFIRKVINVGIMNSGKVFK